MPERSPLPRATTEQCGYDFPRCQRPVIDIAVHLHPWITNSPACEHHLLQMVDPLYR
jgi:hypothetical protein